SDFLNSLDIHNATERIIDYIEEKGYGKRQVTYHLRDWLISRQRYWGPPIPMIYCQACADKGLSWFTSDTEEARLKIKDLGLKNEKDRKSYLLNLKSGSAGWYPEENLPVELPYIKDFKPLGTGGSPLANHPEFYEVKCLGCGGKAERETDVSDTFLDSSWYFLRYLATDRNDIPFPMLNPKSLPRRQAGEARNPKQIQNTNDKSSKSFQVSNFDIRDSSQRLAWLPVTMYIGGAEHSVLHLLYSRFITMFLKDQGLISFEEPFKRFYAHGLIIKEGAKMSKSKGNIINPDQYIQKYGADTLRAYLHFLGPFDQTGDFRDSGVEGMHRFLKKVWKLFSQVESRKSKVESSSEGLRIMNQTIKAVTNDLENLRFNTALAHMMSYYNFLSKQESIAREEIEVYLKLLAPFAPHMAEELYQEVSQVSRVPQVPREEKGKEKARDTLDTRGTRGTFKSIHLGPWPGYDEKYLVSDTVKIPVQINGKLRGMLEVSASDAGDKAKIEQMAKKDEKVAGFLEGQDIKQVIYVDGKVLNFVI
ncbi:MAG TPA: class I tRNA ligase family protein, partial [Xanthomonadales bacterium]|nr:class I tRNA ligase family protein [Xanthomonadales bacterium]